MKAVKINIKDQNLVALSALSMPNSDLYDWSVLAKGELENPTKVTLKIRKKVCQEFLNEAIGLAHVNADDAMNTFKFVYVKAITDNALQSLASDAAAGIAGIKLKVSRILD